MVLVPQTNNAYRTPHIASPLPYLQVLARGCLGIVGEEIGIFEECLIQGLCKAYLQLAEVDDTRLTKGPTAVAFHDRDFIYSLRHLNRQSPGKERALDGSHLCAALIPISTNRAQSILQVITSISLLKVFCKLLSRISMELAQSNSLPFSRHS